MNGTNDKRRAARIPVACTVVVREKLATWTTRTLDVGARGCRLALQRPLAPGTLVRLRLERGDQAPPLDVLGQVAWARKAQPACAGVTFVSAPAEPSGAPAANWIDSLVAAALRSALADGPEAAGGLGGLGAVTLHLGTPPSGALDPSDLGVLRVARDRGPISAVAYAPEGLRALVGLLDRGAVTVGRTSSDPEGWKQTFTLLADAAKAAAAAQRAPGSEPAGAVIVPPLPETLWRKTAVDAMAAEYVRKS